MGGMRDKPPLLFASDGDWASPNLALPSISARNPHIETIAGLGSVGAGG